MSRPAPVVDLFAGPGGLGEGFSSRMDDEGRHVFHVVLSVEMEKYAHETLRLRAFFRQEPEVPEEYYHVLRGKANIASLGSGRTKERWERAGREVLRAKLGGSREDQSRIHEAMWAATKGSDRPLVLIGGPPCQAYSIAGRSRMSGVEGYRPEDDERHTLYREYLKIITDVRPAVFVMENVKGILSSRLHGERIFNRILADLQEPVRALGKSSGSGRLRYTVHPVSESSGSIDFFPDPSSFVIRCEDLGIPQRRHRVIILGIREDLGITPRQLNGSVKSPTVGNVIGDLPKIRSDLSGRSSYTSWHQFFDEGLSNGLLREVRDRGGESVAREMKEAVKRLAATRRGRGGEFVKCTRRLRAGDVLGNWFYDPRIGGVFNHESRCHIDEDLYRYLYASCYALHHGASPKLADFPEALLPDHRNARRAVGSNSMFADRFRVQLKNRPATTITSHISKDGHYYIHYDPFQCRSLTVREAARLQTFPDNYFFCGPRTAQYVQVGNAVPPFLASKIAHLVHEVLSSTGAV
jgi:DNA (cytosine-5)-methyltransferase 1